MYFQKSLPVSRIFFVGNRAAVITALTDFLPKITSGCLVAANRIQTRSYGEEKPAIDGHDESAWGKNRRGEFAIYQK